MFLETFAVHGDNYTKRKYTLRDNYQSNVRLKEMFHAVTTVLKTVHEVSISPVIFHKGVL